MVKELECDLVMRGGITSGIVYPRAIAKLADTYRFRSIGGTSAGAIAASVTAAAALGVINGEDRFQSHVKEVPGILAEKIDGQTVLQRLFQPAPGLDGVLAVLLASLERRSRFKKLVHIALVLWRHYGLWALAGAVIAFLPALLAAAAIGPPPGDLSLYAGVALVVAAILIFVYGAFFALIGGAVGLGIDAAKHLPKNDFGLCTGTGRPDRSEPGIPQRDSAGIPPLTDWLDELIQKVAGRTLLDAPVTFGDLWGNGGNPLAEREIDLVLMTTNATRGVSQRFPFLEGTWGPLFFQESEMRRLFPKRVVDWLIAKSPTKSARKGRAAASKRARREKIKMRRGFYRLPPPAKIPILMGTRMSLSFPFLLSAVPLYAPQYRKSGTAELRRCLFSDGGITSNFPIHFFDSPLPGRPTFGINLVADAVTVVDRSENSGTAMKAGRSRAAVAKDPWRNVWMPTTNSTGVQDVAQFREVMHGPAGIVDFFMMLFDTARNWADTELVAMPGYRDRVVHVALAENEGGLNLSMPPDIITAIGERGECAGKLLTARFARKPGRDPKTKMPIRLTWDNHRWIRYRSVMAAFEDLARRFQKKWKVPSEPRGPRSYPDLLGRKPRSAPRGYIFVPGQDAFAKAATDQFLKLVAAWKTTDDTFDRGKTSKQGRSPRPKPVLRMMPPGSNDPRAERAD